MLVTIPGSVEVYRAVPRVPSGVAEPEPVTTMLRPVKKRLGLVGCLLFSLFSCCCCCCCCYMRFRDDGKK